MSQLKCRTLSCARRSYTTDARQSLAARNHQGALLRWLMWDSQERAWRIRHEVPIQIKTRSQIQDCVVPWRNAETVLFAFGLGRR